jgi:hypothetical protein
MKKNKEPITISELDVQPISDEELQSFVQGSGRVSDICICHDSSSWWECRSDLEEA